MFRRLILNTIMNLNIFIYSNLFFFFTNFISKHIIQLINHFDEVVIMNNFNKNKFKNIRFF